MINAFVVKRVSAILLTGFLSTVLFSVGNIYYALWGGIGFFFAGLLLAFLLATKILSNPFTSMLEGKGIIAFKLDSTGVLQPFNVQVMPPYMIGKLNGVEIKDVFDRDAVFSLAPPIDSSYYAVPHNGGLSINLDEKRLNEARFAMFHFPVILYNDQLKSVITKGELSKTEKNTFAHHSVLYLNRQMEALTFAIRDFGRYIVETMKPKTDIFKSKVFWIIIAVVVIILLALFAPAVMNAIGGFAGNTGSIIPGGSSSAATVTPIP